MEKRGSTGSAQPAIESTYVTPPYTRHFTRPVLIVALLSAQFAALAAIFQRARPEESWVSLLPVVALTVWEAVQTTIWLEASRRVLTNRFFFRVAELILVIVALRLATWMLITGWPDAFATIAQDPSHLLDAPFLLATLLVVPAWLLGIHYADLFEGLVIDAQEAGLYRQYAGSRIPTEGLLPRSRGRLVLSLRFSWIVGGIFLVICSALSTLNLAEIATSTATELQPVNPITGPLVATALIVYFLVGFWLMSHARHASMTARWMIGGTVTHASVARGWRVASLRALALVAFAAAWLPSGNTVPALQIAKWFWGTVLVVAKLVFLPVAGLIAALNALFGGGPSPGPTSDLPFVEDVDLGASSAEPSRSSEPIDLAVADEFLWLAAAVITVWAIAFFLRRRLALDHGWRDRLERIWNAALYWLRDRVVGLHTHLDDVGTLIARARQSPPDTVPSGGVGRSAPRGPQGPRSAREQVRRAYLLAVERARRAGVVRHPAQTPIEYSRDLATAWPEQARGVDTLTAAFIRARYQSVPINASEVTAARRVWRALRRHFRRGRANVNTEEAR